MTFINRPFGSAASKNHCKKLTQSIYAKKNPQNKQ